MNSILPTLESTHNLIDWLAIQAQGSTYMELTARLGFKFTKCGNL